jgi:hypothetical protein
MRVLTTLAASFLVSAAVTAAAPAVGAPALQLSSFQSSRLVEVSAAKSKKKQRANRAYTGTQIACTRYGCRPIPRGCRIETEYIPFTWNPSGFDAVVCPYR